jgi:D-glycero-D-manno-heptose 1,7-bisphosphate phosphatase
MTRRAAFLDRDGVLLRALVRNGKPYVDHDADAMEILPGSAEAVAALRQAGYLTVVVTNQPDVKRGITTKEVVEASNARLKLELGLDAVLTCFHDDDDRCDCRKPKPGLLLQARATYGLDLARSFMIGDRWRDIDAGIAAGCRTVFIDYHYEEERPLDRADFVCGSLKEAVTWMLQPVPLPAR